MPGRLSDLITRRASEDFVGRTAELAVLLQSLEGGGPLVVGVHGIGGVGKSTLLEAFSQRARARGTVVVRLDCRTIEPTERGFLAELGAAIGANLHDATGGADRLSALGERVVLALDTYELLRLLDTWLRQVFVPALGDNVRVVLCGREPLVSAWRTAPGWNSLVTTIPLDTLDDRDAIELLTRADIDPDDARRINRFTRGHPLALKLAAASATDRRWTMDLEATTLPHVVEELTRLYLADIDDPLTRRVLDASAVVRRATLSLLGAMLPDAAPQDAYDRLCALPFVESGRDGLQVHDTVRYAIAAALKAADPFIYREYRRAAWRRLRAEVETAGRNDIWRYTADMLYIIENPVTREAFFPSNAHLYAVEPALPGDDAAIRGIIARNEGPAFTAWLTGWWDRAPQLFRAVRNQSGKATGFYAMFDPSTVNLTDLEHDPVVGKWLEHLRREPIGERERALFCLRWMCDATGEAPSPEQAAAWLDLKRSYMQLRPHLRRVYMIVADLPTYGPIAVGLGFRTVPEANAVLDGTTYHTAMLDFGPQSVDGWLAGLVAGELGIAGEELLDVPARELVLDGARVPLSRLEFGVMHYLRERPGIAVSRNILLEVVWGTDYDGGSNVVDAVVRLLRKKLGEHASCIETISGIGYRFRITPM